MITKADIKRIRSLSRQKYRLQHGQYLIEGRRLVETALETSAPISEVYITSRFQDHPDHQSLLQLIKKRRLHPEIIPDKVMDDLAETVTPSGILGICPLPSDEPPDISKTNNWLYLDRVSDPGNAGTLLRSAAWFDTRHVAFSTDCIDPFHPKVVRGAMGAHFYLSLYNHIDLSLFKNQGFTLIGAHQDGAPLTELSTKNPRPWVLALGSEAHGLSNQHIDLLDQTIAVPRIGQGESLNVAVAGSILLHHLTTA